MVNHILADGTTVTSIEGYVVPITAARLAYEVMNRMNEGRRKYEIENEKESA